MISRKIKELRLSHDLTQKDLADYLNLTPKMVSFYELGQRVPPSDIILKLAEKFHVSTDYLLGNEDRPKGIKIPVLGVIAAGIPIDAVEDIIDYEEIPAKWADTGEYFGLVAHGRSMEPSIFDGDIIIVKKQDFVEDGEIGVVIINGSEATIKQVKCTNIGIKLIGFNETAFAPKEYTREEIDDLPVRIIGKAVEVRRKL